jgi:hypothetical protein
MALEFAVAIKVLDEYMETLKQDLLFSMAERKLKPENTNTKKKIITIKRELDKAVQEKMRLSQIYYGNVNNHIVVTAATA